jgi:sirohydrochlorin ferrochelatase
MTQSSKLPALSDVHVVLCAHGDRRGVDRNSALSRIQQYVEQNPKIAGCDIALLSEPDMLEQCLSKIEGHVIVVPMLFSDGYFYEKILRALSEAKLEHKDLLDPIHMWPNLISEVVKSLKYRDCMLVAHGSKRSSASRKGCEFFADHMQKKNSNLGITQAFLEEAPFANDAIEGLDQPASLVGLFMGSGLHGGEDWGELIAAREGMETQHFTIGEMETLPDIVLATILQSLAVK